MKFIYIVLIIVAIAAVWGYMQGLVKQLGSVAGIVGAAVACRLFGPAAARLFAGSGEPGGFYTVLAYVAVGAAAFFLVWLLARMLRGVIHGARLGVVDRACGAVYKAFLWLIITSLVYNLYLTVYPEKVPSGSDQQWEQRVADFAPCVLTSETAQQLFHTVKSSISDN